MKNVTFITGSVNVCPYEPRGTASTANKTLRGAYLFDRIARKEPPTQAEKRKMTEYTIDELAQAAGTTTRNIRAYQTKQLLPSPRRVGRANVYTEVHLTRLRLINKLLEKGFTTALIADAMRSLEKGEGIEEMLGLEAAIASPWNNEVPTYLELTELLEMFGHKIDPDDVQRAEKLGLLQPEDDRYLVPSPRSLHVGGELVGAGIPLKVVLDQLVELRADVERIAHRFVDLIVDEVFNKYGEDKLPPSSEMGKISEFIFRVRPMARAIVDAELVAALEEKIHDALGDRLIKVAQAQKKNQTPKSKKP